MLECNKARCHENHGPSELFFKFSYGIKFKIFTVPWEAWIVLVARYFNLLTNLCPSLTQLKTWETFD